MGIQAVAGILLAIGRHRHKTSEPSPSTMLVLRALSNRLIRAPDWKFDSWVLAWCDL